MRQNIRDCTKIDRDRMKVYMTDEGTVCMYVCT